MAKTQTLSVDLLRIDAGTQSRISIDEDTVDDYSEIISDSNGEWPLGTLDVFNDGNDYLVADGFHRTLAAKRAKRSSVPCRIHKGTVKDARIFGMTANDLHGLRMSRADKRACVEWLLDNGGKMTQQEISDKAGVSKRLVQQVVADRKSQKAHSARPSGGGATNQHADVSAGGEGGSSAPAGAGTSNGKGTPRDLGKCPNCAGTKWTESDEGFECAKCNHPHGEPAGETDKDRFATQRQKTVKTVEALMRAFDDLNLLKSRSEHGKAIETCKGLLDTAKGWK